MHLLWMRCGLRCFQAGVLGYLLALVPHRLEKLPQHLQVEQGVVCRATTRGRERPGGEVLVGGWVGG